MNSSRLSSSAESSTGHNVGDNDGLGDGTILRGNELNLFDLSDEINQAVETTLGVGTGTNALLIYGDADDSVFLENTGSIAGASWVLDGAESTTYAGYNVYQYTDGGTVFARVVVDDDIPVTPVV